MLNAQISRLSWSAVRSHWDTPGVQSLEEEALFVHLLRQKWMHAKHLVGSVENIGSIRGLPFPYRIWLEKIGLAERPSRLSGRRRPAW